MTDHDDTLELAATAIDFELEPEERAELDRHLAGCDSCRRTAEAYREDAATIAYGSGPRLDSGHSVTILAATLRPQKRRTPVRGLAIAAAVAIVAGGLLVAGLEILRRSNESSVAVLSPSPKDPSNPSPSLDASPPPAGSGRGSPPPVATQRPVGSPTVGAIQVRGDARELGTLIRLAPGPAGDLYVSIPASDGTVLGRLDETGVPAPGWPVFLPGSELCDQLLPIANGSVRLLCHRPASEEGLGGMITRVHAFDANGQPLPGWPVEIDDVVVGRMVGDDLVLLVKPYVGDVSEMDTPEPVFMGIVAADGTSRRGAEVSFECCEHSWAVGPDGTGYGTTHRDWETSVTTDVAGFDTGGLRAGWPITVEGNLSELAFDTEGRVFAVLGSPSAEPARTLVWDRDGRSLPGSADQSIVSTNPWSGAGADYPGAPIVATDGTSYIVGSLDERYGAYAFDLSGHGIAGWPYDSALPFQDTGFCPPGDTGCGGFRTAPAVGPGNVLYLVHAPAKASVGGSVVAIGRDGGIVDGWPVTLTRSGSEFWSVVVGPNSTAYAMAVEPEPDGSYSATILAIAPDSDILYNVTIVEP
jgi:Putative zinc-finger